MLLVRAEIKRDRGVDLYLYLNCVKWTSVSPDLCMSKIRLCNHRPTYVLCVINLRLLCSINTPEMQMCIVLLTKTRKENIVIYARQTTTNNMLLFAYVGADGLANEHILFFYFKIYIAHTRNMKGSDYLHRFS